MMMFPSNEPGHARSTDQVSVTVVRKSDGQSLTFVLNEKTRIHDLKHELKRRLKPSFENGCRLIFRDKLLKGRHTLKHYGIKKGVNDQAIASKFNINFSIKYFFFSWQNNYIILFSVDDTKDWKSSSSSSSSESDREK